MIELQRLSECQLFDSEDLESARDLLHAAWQFNRALHAFCCETGYDVKVDDLLGVLADRPSPAMTDIEVAFLVGRVADL
jgi:hypothetical protein